MAKKTGVDGSVSSASGSVLETPPVQSQLGLNEPITGSLVECYHVRHRVPPKLPSACVKFAARLRTQAPNLCPSATPARFHFTEALDPARDFKFGPVPPPDVAAAMRLLVPGTTRAGTGVGEWCRIERACERVAEWLTLVGDVEKAVPYRRQQIFALITACQHSKWRLPSSHEPFNVDPTSTSSSMTSSTGETPPPLFDNTCSDRRPAPSTDTDIRGCVHLLVYLGSACQSMGGALAESGDPTAAIEWLERGLGVFLIACGVTSLLLVDGLHNLAAQYAVNDAVETWMSQKTSAIWRTYLIRHHRDALDLVHGPWGMMRVDIAALFDTIKAQQKSGTIGDDDVQRLVQEQFVFLTSLFPTTLLVAPGKNKEVEKMAAGEGKEEEANDEVETEQIKTEEETDVGQVKTQVKPVTEEETDVGRVKTQVKPMTEEETDVGEVKTQVKSVTEEETDVGEVKTQMKPVTVGDREECRLALMHLYQTWRDFKFSTRDSMVRGAETLLLETEAVFPFDSPPLCAAHVIMSDVYLLWCMYDDALSHLRSAYAAAMRNSPRNDDHYDVATRLVRCLLQLNKCDEALAVVERSIGWLHTLPRPLTTHASLDHVGLLMSLELQRTSALFGAVIVVDTVDDDDHLLNDIDENAVTTKKTPVSVAVSPLPDVPRRPSSFVPVVAALQRAGELGPRLNADVIGHSYYSLALKLLSARRHAAMDVRTPHECWNCGRTTSLIVPALGTLGEPKISGVGGGHDHQMQQTISPSPKCCARCGRVRYCCRQCQILDWRLYHKAECATFQTLSMPCSEPSVSSSYLD
jgi:hypothetical protein